MTLQLIALACIASSTVTHGDLRFTVKRVSMERELQSKNILSGAPTIVAASDGMRFAVVEMEIANLSVSKSGVDAREYFSVTDDDNVAYDWDFSGAVAIAIAKDAPHDIVHVRANATTTVWLVYQVPSKTRGLDLIVAGSKRINLRPFLKPG